MIGRDNSEKPVRGQGPVLTGQILRRGSDEKIIWLIVDMVDSNSCLRAQYPERVKVYAARYFPTEKHCVRWNEIPLVYYDEADSSGLPTHTQSTSRHQPGHRA